MTETDLAKITNGWNAEMKGTYWDGEMVGIKEEILKCIQPIKPNDMQDFEPDRFIFKLPADIHSGSVVVFSRQDIKRWIPPETNSKS